MCLCTYPASSSTVSAVSVSSWSSGRQCLPAAAPGANSRGQQWRCSLQDHPYSSHQHHVLRGNSGFSVILRFCVALLKTNGHTFIPLRDKITEIFCHLLKTCFHERIFCLT